MKPCQNKKGNFLHTLQLNANKIQKGKLIYQSGKAWQPLKDKTIKLKEKRGKGRSILEYEGNMFAKNRPLYKANSSGVIVGFDAKSGNNYPYAVVHQFGSKDKTIPKRAFLPVNDKELNEEVKEKILEEIREYLAID